MVILGSVRSTPGHAYRRIQGSGRFIPAGPCFLPFQTKRIGQTGERCNNRYMELMDTRQVAAKAKVTVPTVTRWVADGNLKAVHKGDGLRGAYVFDKAEVERWLAERADKYNP